MGYRIEISKIAPEDWDKLVKNAAGGTVYQTTYWADFVKSYYKSTPYFLTVYEDDSVLALLLFFKQTKCQDFLTKNILARLTTQLSKMCSTHIEFIAGPVMLSERAIASELLETALLKFAQRHKIRSLTGSGPINSSFLCKKLKVDWWSTFLIDLRQSEKQLWSNLNKGLRKNIRRTEKSVLVSITRSKSQLKEYCKLLLECKSKLKKANFRKYLKNLVTMQDKLVAPVYHKTFLASLHGDFISGLASRGFGRLVNEVGIARSHREKKAKIYAQDLLKWCAILDAKRVGFRYFDLSGAAITPINKREVGILRYKKKWGGQRRTYPTYALK